MDAGHRGGNLSLRDERIMYCNYDWDKEAVWGKRYVHAPENAFSL